MVTLASVYNYLEEVKDPEIPALSIRELGILRNVTLDAETWVITITPTYSGCPAMQTIEQDINTTLKHFGIENFRVESVLSPAWTTDWMTEEGKAKLQAFGIAPPVNELDKSTLFAKPIVVPCPQCLSENTKMVSQFGSTACKAHYQCNACLEPFDYFKCFR
jgi:ring-1,2-phenylacetyl-CoA epoxidase subunit PaaD